MILLCKWWWKIENEKGIWQDIIKISIYRIKAFMICLAMLLILLLGMILSELKIIILWTHKSRLKVETKQDSRKMNDSWISLM
ncbi:hypothetical protein Zm00014a_023270 [Zea mays]|jgi:hypothetical protein|uniref:Uncharacterized protein n=1 Tax=Zea mays TaxID=4577 RepID=A0A317Y8E9_MAIZE|nr:hypothetical protein Zm00014a_023270 [Zea mays]